MSDPHRNSRVRVVVRGRVQGVWYRQSCVEQARSLGLSGWVRNRDDGAVEVEAEGDPAALDALVAWMAEGPPLARVDHLERHDLGPIGSGADTTAGFEVH